MFQLTIVLVMTSFMTCNSQIDGAGLQEVSNATRMATPTLMHTDGRVSSDSGIHKILARDTDRKLFRRISFHGDAQKSHSNKTQKPEITNWVNVTSSKDHDSDAKQYSDSGLSREWRLLFSSSSPQDLLEDAELAELFNKGGIWTNDKQLRKKLKPFWKKISRKGLVSRKMYRRFSMAAFVLVVVFIIMGLITNVLAFKVFRRLGKNVTNVYMVCLTCFDITYLVFVVCAIVTFLLVFRVTWLRAAAGQLLWLYDFALFFTVSFRQVIIVTTALMSLDRYVFIACHFNIPKATVILRRPRILVAVFTFFILTLNIHILLKRKVSSSQVQGINQTVSYLTYSDLYLQNRQVFDDLAIAGSCLFQYCPLLVMLLANVSLMVSLHRYSSSVRVRISPAVPPKEKRAKTSAARNKIQENVLLKTPFPGSDTPDSVLPTISGLLSNEDASLSSKAKSHRQFFRLEKGKCVTVVVYSLLFFLLALPMALLPILRKAFPEFNSLRSQHYLFLMYIRLFSLLDTLSTSTNFFVFFIKGGAFRAAVIRLVRCRRRQTGRRGTFKLPAGNTRCKETGRGWPEICSDGSESDVVLKRSVIRKQH